MRLNTLIRRSIFQRRTRSMLTISGVAVAVAAVVALVGIARGFERSLLAVYEGRGVDLMVVRAGNVQRMSSVLDESLGEKIRRLPGVQDVSPALGDSVSFEEYGIHGVVVRGLAPNSHGLGDMKLMAGRSLQPGDRRVVLLGRVLARDLDKHVEDTLKVVGEEFQVVGVYESYNVLENSSLIMPLGELQRLMEREGKVTLFTVVGEDKDEASLERLRGEIVKLTTGIAAMPAREYVDKAVEMRLARAIAWLTSTIALVVGTIGMINTMSTAVFERTQELAVLRAIGWRKWSVMKLILLESVVLGLAGAVLGTLLAIALTQLLSLIPASGRLVGGDVAPDVILQGFAVAVLVGVAGGLYPAFRAAQLQPTEGLRHE